MTPFTEQAKQYTWQHHNRLTWYTHLAGVPLIVFSLIILLGFMHLVVPNVFDIKIADIAVIALLIYYFRLNWLLALILTPVFIVMLFLADLINYAGPTEFAVWAFIIIFLIGCGLQLIGHLIEGNKPAFWDNPWNAFATPMFILAEIFFMAGKMNKLKAEIHGDEVADTMVIVEEEKEHKI